MVCTKGFTTIHDVTVVVSYATVTQVIFGHISMSTCRQ